MGTKSQNAIVTFVERIRPKPRLLTKQYKHSFAKILIGKQCQFDEQIFLTKLISTWWFLRFEFPKKTKAWEFNAYF